MTSWGSELARSRGGCGFCWIWGRRGVRSVGFGGEEDLGAVFIDMGKPTRQRPVGLKDMRRRHHSLRLLLLLGPELMDGRWWKGVGEDFEMRRTFVDFLTVLFGKVFRPTLMSKNTPPLSLSCPLSGQFQNPPPPRPTSRSRWRELAVAELKWSLGMMPFEEMRKIAKERAKRREEEQAAEERRQTKLSRKMLMLQISSR
jgi:hypothetical protein